MNNPILNGSFVQKGEVMPKKRKKIGAQGIRARKSINDKSGRIKSSWDALSANQILLKANPGGFFGD